MEIDAASVRVRPNTCAEPPPSTSRDTGLTTRGWWTKTSTALSDLSRAREFDINTLIIENDLEVAWNAITDGLALYDFSEQHRRKAASRRPTDALRARFRAITARADELGIESYLMCPEVHVPRGFEGLSYDNPELWSLIRERLQEVFRALPDLSGYLLYLCEGEQEVFEIPGAEASGVKRVRRLIDTVWEACTAENRKFLVTTFIHRPHKLEAIVEALRSFPPHPDFAVLQYCCPNDWGLYAVSNPAIGKVGSHPEILAFDYAAENWGQGVHPFVQIDFMARRLGEALQRSGHIVGLAGYVAWYGRSVLGTFNEANVYAGAALAETPDRDGPGILREWCDQRFGEQGAAVAAACLARTHDAVFKAQHIFGYWLDTTNKSGLPSLQELDEYFIGDSFGEALCSWDPAYQRTWDKIQAPDDDFLAEILTEKQEAVRLCRRSLEEVRAARERFRPADFGALERAFAFQELWSRLWREQAHAFFLRQIARRDGLTPDCRARLEEVLEAMSREADELEARFGKGVFPRGPDRARQFVLDVRREILQS